MSPIFIGLLLTTSVFGSLYTIGVQESLTEQVGAIVSAVSKDSASRCSNPALTLNRSMMTSIVCFLRRSSAGTSSSSSGSTGSQNTSSSSSGSTSSSSSSTSSSSFNISTFGIMRNQPPGQAKVTGHNL